MKSLGEVDKWISIEKYIYVGMKRTTYTIDKYSIVAYVYSSLVQEC